MIVLKYSGTSAGTDGEYSVWQVQIRHFSRSIVFETASSW